MHAYCSIRLHSLLCQQEHFYSMHATEHRVPTIFNLQVWDNDVISDDYLGITNYSEIRYIFMHFQVKSSLIFTRCHCQPSQKDVVIFYYSILITETTSITHAHAVVMKIIITLYLFKVY